MSVAPSSGPQTMADFIRHVSERATDQMPDDTAKRVADLAARFDAICGELPPAPLTVVVFHLSLPQEHSKLDYADVKIDLGAVDYEAVLRHNFAMARGFNPDCRIVYIVNEGDAVGFVPPDVVVVPLPLNPAWLMYERVVAMCAFMQSKAFAANTVFLDSDAFANWPLARVFRLPFDIAVTSRPDRGIMPVNEGVIFAGHRPGQAARGFFRRYLATYENLRADAAVQSVYGDIRRWRGGQLSLNAAAMACGVLAESDPQMIGGAWLRHLPCADYNFFIRANVNYPPEQLRRKYVLHLKGETKGCLPLIADFQRDWKKQVMAETIGPPAGYIKPFFGFFNKEYSVAPFDRPEVKQRFAGSIQDASAILGANRPGSGATVVDDMMVWFRNLGFLQQPDFISAFGSYAEDPVLRARIWRVYMLCWAAKSCLRLPGDFMDVGCYDGRTVEVMERYCDFRNQAGKTWWLYDMFENPPEEARKSGHGPALFEQVKQSFAACDNVRVIKGAVPESFAQGLPEKVAFAQLDLNVAAPELAALEIIYDRIVPGGIIVFDDFGFRRYRDSHDAEMAFFRARGDVLWESPTGQGLFIKR